jgi:hypothetical protein
MDENHKVTDGPAPGSFSFDLTVRHQSYDPASISSGLLLEPTFCWRAGDAWSAGVHTTTRWNASLSHGSEEKDFDTALRAIVALLNKRKDWCRQFIDSGGEIDITLIYRVDPSAVPASEGNDGPQTRSLVFHAELYPEFIAALSAVGVGLRLQVFE